MSKGLHLRSKEKGGEKKKEKEKNRGKGRRDRLDSDPSPNQNGQAEFVFIVSSVVGSLRPILSTRFRGGARGGEWDGMGPTTSLFIKTRQGRSISKLDNQINPHHPILA